MENSFFHGAKGATGLKSLDVDCENIDRLAWRLRGTKTEKHLLLAVNWKNNYHPVFLSDEQYTRKGRDPEWTFWELTFVAFTFTIICVISSVRRNASFIKFQSG